MVMKKECSVCLILLIKGEHEFLKAFIFWFA